MQPRATRIKPTTNDSASCLQSSMPYKRIVNWLAKIPDNAFGPERREQKRRRVETTTMDIITLPESQASMDTTPSVKRRKGVVRIPSRAGTDDAAEADGLLFLPQPRPDADDVPRPQQAHRPPRIGEEAASFATASSSRTGSSRTGPTATTNESRGGSARKKRALLELGRKDAIEVRNFNTGGVPEALLALGDELLEVGGGGGAIVPEGARARIEKAAAVAGYL